jgi:acyl homoserine lactone synthase
MLFFEKEILNRSIKAVVRSMFIREEDFIVKNLTRVEEKFQAYHLRHKIFAQELRWVSQSDNGLEIDDYDKDAVFCGVFDKQHRLLSFLRLILPDAPFMLEKEFSSLLGEHKIRKENDTVEVSRLCVAPDARNNTVSGNFGIHSISMLLYKGVYHLCKRNSIRYLYLVVEHKIYRLLCSKGFPCKLIGQPVQMPDGIITVAAIMDWSEFEMLNAVKRPKMLRWFTQYQSGQVELQLLQPEFYSQLQAFA